MRGGGVLARVAGSSVSFGLSRFRRRGEMREGGHELGASIPQGKGQEQMLEAWLG